MCWQYKAVLTGKEQRCLHLLIIFDICLIREVLRLALGLWDREVQQCDTEREAVDSIIHGHYKLLMKQLFIRPDGVQLKRNA